ncbi:17686_t:CDS:1 [Dentiscutata erythropus]|uniref:17686_t:CDS:1 n=1 Tax=Dentiscutata erythropus TaxID=1348616 RepID=A0A9N9N6X7_9GLOM|nr:17686_t:CDS:1 [Dentiscutata erythropus]
MSHLNGSNKIDVEHNVIQKPGSSSVQTDITLKEKAKIALRIILLVLFTIDIPIFLYVNLSNQIWIIWALVISIIPPVISITFNFIFRKQFDVLGMLSIIVLVSTIILNLFNVPKFYSLGASFVFGVVGLVLVITLIPIKVGSFEMRPFLYYCSKNYGIGNYEGLTKDEPFTERCERYWRTYASFRRPLIIVTAVWGFVFLIELLIRIIIVYNTNGVDVNNRAFFYAFPFLGVSTAIYVIWVHRKRFKEKICFA